MSDQANTVRLRLSEVCWPVFDYLITFLREVRHGATLPQEAVRDQALLALHDAAELAGQDSIANRLWETRIKPMLVYLLDYRMINCDWAGNDYWWNHCLETSSDGLGHPEALGGEKFFEACDQVQKDLELATRHERPDCYELTELLSLHFICLRLGFKGAYHERPRELADYTRRLFTSLPAYATTHDKQMFRDAYEHNQVVKVDYRLGRSLAIVLVSLLLVLSAILITFQCAWYSATDDIARAAGQVAARAVPGRPLESGWAPGGRHPTRAVALEDTSDNEWGE